MDGRVGALVEVCVADPCLLSFRFGQLLRCAHKRIVNIIKVYIERSNVQVELIQFRNKYRLYSRLFLRSKEFNVPACLRLESRYTISLFNSRLITLIIRDMPPMFCAQSSPRKSFLHIR